MVDERALLMITTICYLTDISSAVGCNWSNEGCNEDRDCCSGSCSRNHPGTGPRCEKSGVGLPCFYNYHCERTQICGIKNKCCSGYWQDCRDKRDCCNPLHVCLHTHGFVYKKCLYGPVRPKNSSIQRLTSLSLIIVCLTCLKSVLQLGR